MTNITVLTLNKKNITNFAKERNILLSDSRTDWVIFLDSDEKLLKPINTVNEKQHAYFLKRKNYFLDQYVGTDTVIRLVKKGTGEYVRKVHETWVSKNNDLVGIFTDNYIIHNTADNVFDYLKKINYYSDLHALANLEEHKKSNLFKIIFFPVGKFIITLIKSRHLIFSIMQSLHSYLSWTKMYFRTEQN